MMEDDSLTDGDASYRRSSRLRVKRKMPPVAEDAFTFGLIVVSYFLPNSLGTQRARLVGTNQSITA
jgi:hypothetical protein